MSIAPTSLAGTIRSWAPVALVVAIAAIGLGFVALHPEGLFNRHSDLLAEALATQEVFHRSFLDGGGWPLWRNDLLSGGPALTNPRALYTHPVHLLFALFEPARVVGLVMWLQMLLAGVGGYCAGSVLRLSIPGRLMVAVGVLLSFKTILAVYAGWLPVISALASMPLLFAAVGALLDRPSFRNTMAAGGAGALALHSGHPQITYYAVLLIAIWAAVRLIRCVTSGDRVHAVATARSLAGGAVLAVGLSAYLLLPIALDAREATRASSDYAFFLGARPLTPVHLLTAISPELFGTPLENFVEGWEYIFYCGAVSSLLAVFAAIYGRRRHLTVTLLVALALSVGLSIDTPLLRVTYEVVPGFALFRLPGRMLFLSAFFVFCLAGVGLDALLASANSARARQVLATVLIAAVALEGSYWARRYLRTPQPISYPVSAEFVGALESGDRLMRIAPLSRTAPAYGFAAAFGLQSIAGYDPFNFRRYQTYMDILRYGRSMGPRAEVWTDIDRIARVDLLAALNVGYLVSPRPLDPIPPDYVLAGEYRNQPQFRFYEGLVSGPVYLYRHLRPLGRAFFVDSVRAVAGPDDMAHDVERVDLRETAVAVSSEGGSSPASEGDRVDVLRSAAGGLDLLVRASARRFLVVSEVWHSGWSARVDGLSRPLLRTDVALQGLWIEPGEHRVEIRFWPTGLTAGLLVSMLTLAAVILAGWRWRSPPLP